VLLLGEAEKCHFKVLIAAGLGLGFLFFKHHFLLRFCLDGLAGLLGEHLDVEEFLDGVEGVGRGEVFKEVLLACQQRLKQVVQVRVYNVSSGLNSPQICLELLQIRIKFLA